MRHIAPPTFGVAELLDDCEPSPHVTSIEAVRAELLRAEASFISNAQQATLHLTPRQEPGISGDAGLDIKWLYKQRILPKRSNAHKYYNSLRAAAPFGKCPHCMRNDVSALDHHLPKKHFAAHAITPANLVPICDDCNGVKLTSSATSSTDETLHPYFDDLGFDNWLHAAVEEEEGALITFSVRKMPLWDVVFQERVENHFADFELADLYRGQAIALLGNIRLTLTKLHQTYGSNAVRESVLDSAASWAAENSEPWNSAALQAWAESAWFCDGGFGLLVIGAADLVA